MGMQSEPRYPVYIVSKGRWDSRLTSKSLERMRVPYHIVVEPQEYDRYAAVINPCKILTLPPDFGEGTVAFRRRGNRQPFDVDKGKPR